MSRLKTIKKVMVAIPGLRSAKKLLNIVINPKPYIRLYVAPGHYYSTIPDTTAIAHRVDRLLDQNLDQLPAIDLNQTLQVQLFKEFKPFFKRMNFPANKSQLSPTRYYYENEMYAYGDAASLYAMLCRFQPKNIVEVGSGYSTALMLDVKDTLLPKLNLTCIEPYPQRLLNQLKPGDATHFELLQTSLELVNLKVFDSLRANDFLFIDSSHVSKLGSDVNYYIFNILPRLKSGVIIHIHDILWPFEYPQYMVNEQRWWNEAYVLRAYLEHNQDMEIIFWPSYLEAKQKKLLSQCNLFTNKKFGSGGSIWLKKK